MHPFISEVSARLTGARTALRAAVEAVPAAARTRRPAEDRWSVAEVLEHLSIVEGLFTQRVVTAIAEARQAGVGQERATERLPLPPDIAGVLLDRVNRRNAPEPARPRGIGPDAAWAAVERSRATLLDALAAADGLALSEVKTSHPAFGTLTVYQMVELIAGHEMRHTAQIREIADHLAPA